MPDSACRVLAVIPPMTQLNTPYPSTAYLTGFLRSRGLGAELVPPLSLVADGRGFEAARVGGWHQAVDQPRGP